MGNYCKIEFYFKKEAMLDLINQNPDAKGIIIKQEIKPRKNAGEKGFTNVTRISAYTIGNDGTGQPNGPATKDALAFSRIEGCPYPPGCDGDS